MVSKVQPHSEIGEEVSQRYNRKESDKIQQHREGNTMVIIILAKITCKDNMPKHQTITIEVNTKQMPNNIQGI